MCVLYVLWSDMFVLFRLRRRTFVFFFFSLKRFFISCLSVVLIPNGASKLFSETVSTNDELPFLHRH